jgi:L-ribulose-5-phosphate 4-epimerase
MHEELKRVVHAANLMLREFGLVPFTWGNASQIDEERRFVVIKPSGVKYEDLTEEQMCVLNASDGSVAEGAMNPSTDAPTHLEIYRRFPGVFGVAHTHSAYATAFAQAGLGISCYGTTHADYFYGEVPCARALSAEEILESYELNTGGVIADTFYSRGIDPLAMPGALVSGHGPFTWGGSAAEAVSNAAYLEETARLAYMTIMLSPQGATPVSQALLDKHYNRKHGAGAYYGQK